MEDNKSIPNKARLVADAEACMHNDQVFALVCPATFPAEYNMDM
jgi:hypothetical protein